MSRPSRLGLFVFSGLILAVTACGAPTSGSRSGGRPTYYLALGDSLAAGYGSGTTPSDRECRDHNADRSGARGYVCLFFARLRRVSPNLRLVNLALASDPGEDSCSFLHVISCAGSRRRRDVAPGDRSPFAFTREAQISAAMGVLRSHRQPGVISLDIGGNDFAPLLAETATGKLNRATRGLRAAERRFARNLRRIVRQLRGSAPQAVIILADQYDPLSGVPAAVLGPEGAVILRDAQKATESMRRSVLSVSRRYRAGVADVGARFKGRALALTRIAQGANVHPSPAGYRVYAALLWQTYRAAPRP